VESFYCFGEITFNSKFLNFLSQNQIPLHIFNYYGYYSGSYYAREYLLSGFLVVNQVQHYLDPEKRLMLNEKHFDQKLNSCYLEKKGKNIYVKDFDERLKTKIFHRNLKRKVSYRRLIRLECYKRIKHLTSEKQYNGFRAWR
jgi:CRISPR/Cas system-associated endonuclease Cas1